MTAEEAIQNWRRQWPGIVGPYDGICHVSWAEVQAVFRAWEDIPSNPRSQRTQIEEAACRANRAEVRARKWQRETADLKAELAALKSQLIPADA